MLNLNPLFEFSRTNCVAICAFLVPANLLLTVQTILVTGLKRPQTRIRQAAILACLPAFVMVLHVLTWWMVGIVMAPTYILLWLAATCLSINVWAIIHPLSLNHLLQAIVFRLQLKFGTVLPKWVTSTVSLTKNTSSFD